MGFLKQVSQYFTFKKQPDAEHWNREIRFMHGTNRISIYVFILCLIILTIKLLVKH